VRKEKRITPEVMKELTFPKVSVITNVGKQYIDIDVKVTKHYVSNRDRTLFEKYILGYKDYFYRIDCEYKQPIRQNRDKDFLGSFTEEGNDCTYSCSIGLGYITNHSIREIEKIINNDRNIYIEILKSLRGYNPKHEQHKLQQSKSWKNKTLFRKNFYLDEDYNKTIQVQMWTGIYPFHGHDLSGCTDIFSLDIGCSEGENYIQLGLLGVHFHLGTNLISQFFRKIYAPKYTKGNIEKMSKEVYNEMSTEKRNLIYDKCNFRKNKKGYYEIYQLKDQKEIDKEWKDLRENHKIKYFLIGDDWGLKFSVKRALGVRLVLAKGWEDKNLIEFNLLRNKFWNLI
jgi:hypothetical protein